ncbi:unnamed protein product [Rotaria sp. Silwood1]|nr:unnamed protein product [Rotaria sp. Silwood1]CAF1625388.1 unnamed protein product [Rotaria sp. Silwood1]
MIEHVDFKERDSANKLYTLDDKNTKLQECDDKVSLYGTDIEGEFSRYHSQRPRSRRIDSNPATGIQLNRVDYYVKLMREILDYIYFSYAEYHKTIEEKLIHFQNVLPGCAHLFSLQDANNLAQLVPGVSCAALLHSEIELLKDDIDSCTELPEFIDKLRVIRSGYPNAVRVYQFLLTLPISVATNERSFSKLKLVKNYLRSTLSNDKLEWLMLCSLEKDLLQYIDLSSFAEDWALSKNRRIKVLPNT